MGEEVVFVGGRDVGSFELTEGAEDADVGGVEEVVHIQGDEGFWGGDGGAVLMFLEFRFEV